jgi:hypothetical protein
MPTFTKTLLSGSTQGKPIKVVATATLGTTIHATGTSSANIDEVWLYAYNSSTGPVALTVEFGGASVPDQNIKIDVPPTSGLTLVVPGLVLTGTGAAANTVTAFAGTANVVTVSGYVNRIS